MPALSTSHRLIVCLVAAGGCSAPPSTEAPAEAAAAIDSLNARIVDFYRTGAADSLASLYHANATILLPNAPPVRGPEAVTAHWHRLFAGYDWALTLARESFSADGDIAVEHGRYAVTMTAEGTDAPLAQDQGNYLVVWQRTDSGWRVRYDVGVSSSRRRPAQ